jgi:cysteinyl-tRNA synthetase
MAAAERGVERLAAAVAGPAEPKSTTSVADEARARFIESMDDDFNTPGAIAALFDLAREVNRHLESGDGNDAAAARRVLRELADVLGLRLRPRIDQRQVDAAPFVELLLHLRQELRAAKNFQLADSVRDDLSRLGVTVEDRPGASTWRHA